MNKQLSQAQTKLADLRKVGEGRLVHAHERA